VTAAGGPARRSPVRWDGTAIEIVDQARLPATLEYLRLETVDAAVDAIRRLAVRGAPAIGGCGALAMVLGIDSALSNETDLSLPEAREIVAALAGRIVMARPTAVNLSWAVRRVAGAAAGAGSIADIHELALAEALRVIEEDREACRRIGEIGRAELAGRSTLLTHCNTGWLATLGWGTALGIVYAKAAAGEPVHVFACEARPLLQGARLTAWELIDAGIDVTLVADGAAAPLLASGRIDAVVVGADRIVANGDVANKIGTLGIAIAARRSGVPFYVVAPTSSFDPTLATGEGIVIEERPADEVRTWQGRLAAPAGVNVWNPAFDVTPAELVTAYITEVGVLHPPFDDLPTAPSPHEAARESAASL
jgi:methylthioribose-1-phosphate isomerase